MTDHTASDPLADRLAQLAELPAHLRSTHLGIDTAIDRVLDAVRPWHLFAETQQRPRVVGLWGMTGTGKSTLVRSVVEHLQLTDRTFWLDAGECRKPSWLDNTLERLLEHHDGKPFVLVVDEFQHARTIKGGTEQEEPGELRRLWELLDSGRTTITEPNTYQERSLMDMADRMRACLAQGVKVKHGRVTRGLAVYRNIMLEETQSHRWRNHRRPRRLSEMDADPQERWLIPSHSWEWLRDALGRGMSMLQLEYELEQLDGPATLAWVEALLARMRTPPLLDGSKALVLVLGNLDELYVGGKEPWPEMDPDVLLRRHRQLGTAGVHQALLELFRVEQVGRLGTDHIVFPPMGRETVVLLLRRETDALAERLGAGCGIRLTVGNALLAHLQAEATIAVLGARPLIEAVQRVLPVLFAEAVGHATVREAQAVELDWEGRRAVARVPDEGVAPFPLRWPLPAKSAHTEHPEDLRRYAVHEAGHVVCGELLAGRKALQVCARTSQERTGGFVLWDRDTSPVITRQRAIGRLAALLGGWAAERVVFGADAVSTGCQGDLQMASNMALDLVKETGLGNDRLFHAEHPESPGPGFRTRLADVEAQAVAWLTEAESLALRTLEAERALVDALVAKLQQHGSLGPDAIAAVFLAVRGGEVRPELQLA